MLKYLYGGTFEKCKLFFDTHCIGDGAFSSSAPELWNILPAKLMSSPLLDNI